jgi:hypothetical protein
MRRKQTNFVAATEEGSRSGRQKHDERGPLIAADEPRPEFPDRPRFLSDSPRERKKRAKNSVFRGGTLAAADRHKVVSR